VEPKLQKIKIERTAHVYTLGADAHTAEDIWLVFHGYGQLASRIIRKFDEIEDRRIHVIAPEGLSKFYFKRNPLILGASWMTKMHREDEIEDYLNYLDQIYHSLDLRANQNFNVLGFSQGSATMMRWINHARPNLGKLVIWAGEFPPDLDYEMAKSYFKTISKKYYCLGNRDEFFTSEIFDKMTSFVSKYDLGFQYKHFQGKHEINRKLLAQIIAE